MAEKRVALTHDHLIQDGGAERVVRALFKAFPDAPLYTAYYAKHKMGPDFAGRTIRTSYLNKIPLFRHFYKLTLPLLDGAFRRFKLAGYDVVVSSASGWAKSVRTGNAVHVCYCHTPIRYIWSDADSYIASTGYPAPLKAFFKLIRGRLRKKDLRAAAGVDYFIANSRYVADRIERYYGRDSEVIYPPVDISAFTPTEAKGDYFLVATRLEPYKRVELAIEAANRLKVPLKIMGSGTARKQLEAMAGPTVEFTGRVSDEERAKLFAEAVAMLNPQEEDFGITTVEGLASGTPVVAYELGGAGEIIEDGVHGLLFEEQTPESLAVAMEKVAQQEWPADTLRKRAEEFSEERFVKEIKTFVEQVATAKASGNT